MPRRQVVMLVILSELLLAILAGGLIWLTGIHIPISYSPSSMITGLLAAFFLLLINLPLFEFAPAPIDRALRLSEFRSSVIFPLVGKLTMFDAVLVGISSGFAEELFFRGFLQTWIDGYLGTELGVVLSALLFALIHFGSASWEFRGLVILYFVVGVVLSGEMLHSNSLLAPMVTHGLYNFLTIVFLRRYSLARLGLTLTCCWSSYPCFAGSKIAKKLKVLD